MLNTPADIAAYIDTYRDDGTQEDVLRVLNTVARSKGMSALAAQPVHTGDGPVTSSRA